jgi:UDP-N-acetylmuramate: L-alanyl-gamma-D-glutamyl-meso-diaminopimelate ligase
MEPYSAETVKDAFSRADLMFYNDPSELQKYLENVESDNTNLLMMSSGNFGGIDLQELSKKYYE